MKKYLIFAASALALASCSSDDFLGENPGTAQNATTAINFGGEAGKITRATSNEGDDNVKLDNQFKVYGVKTTDGTMFHNVFVDYSVWYDENLTTSNTKKWEYVGQHNQTIKYWDYSAKEYRFVAGSPINAFTYNKDLENISTIGTVIKSATVTGLAGHIKANEAGPAIVTNPVYVAEPKIVKKEDYKNPVQFNFIRQQSMVRVGLYETIPGYKVSNVRFYAYDNAGDLKVTTKNNIILTSSEDGYFVGGKDVSGTVTYKWDDAPRPSYTFAYTDNDDLKKSKNWYAGKLGTLAETSLGTLTEPGTDPVAILYGTDKDMSDKGYFTVLPTPSATTANAIVIKCDYTLTSDDGSGETIEVKGATAAIPAAFSKWDVNTRYTYLFKISDNTNGYTGDDPTKAGLFPITFDAVVAKVEDKTQGTTTIVKTPSITTYQDGSVTDKGIEYKPGKEIKVTVTNADGTEPTLNSTDNTAVGYVAVYKLSKERTEADLQLDKVTTDEFTDTNKKGVTLATDKKSFTFTPNEAGFYAIQYLTTAEATDPTPTPAAYTYKVVEVK